MGYFCSKSTVKALQSIFAKSFSLVVENGVPCGSSQPKLEKKERKKKLEKLKNSYFSKKFH